MVVNKKLLNTMEYVSMFDIRIIYKPKHDYLVPDALNRLPTNPTTAINPTRLGELDSLLNDREEHWAFAAHSAFLTIPPMKTHTPKDPMDLTELFCPDGPESFA